MEATLMKVLGVLSTTALLLMLGTAVPAFAQDEHQDAKPEKQEEAKPEKQQEAAKPAKQEEAAKPAKQEEQAKPERQQEQAKTEKQTEAKPAKEEEKAKPAQEEKQAKTEKRAEAKPAKEEEKAKPAKQEEQAKQENHGNAGGQQHAQRTEAEQQRQRSVPALRLSARSESRIPDARFRSNFGRGHEFRIGSPTLVGGYSRFQYGGYWFGFVQPWPDGWYYTDDVYVDYIDGGYYLCNPYYPGAQVSISVVL
jgi:outer membrane biosynthesis protein TonB